MFKYTSLNPFGFIVIIRFQEKPIKNVKLESKYVLFIIRDEYNSM